MWPIFKTKVVIYYSKANLDSKILFGSIPHLTSLEMRKMLERHVLGTTVPHSILVHNLLSIEIRIQHLKLAMQTSMPHKSWTRMECGILDSLTNPLQAF